MGKMHIVEAIIHYALAPTVNGGEGVMNYIPQRMETFKNLLLKDSERSRSNPFPFALTAFQVHATVKQDYCESDTGQK